MLKANLMKMALVFLMITMCSAMTSAKVAPRTWVFFADKGYHHSEDLGRALRAEAEKLLPATRSRLMKVRPPGALIMGRDLPVCTEYLREIAELTGIKPHSVIRSLNAASFSFDEGQIETVRQLRFVKSVRPVFRFKSEREEPVVEPTPKQNYRCVQDSADYGYSWLQNAMENFPRAHENGYSGEGVLVGALDAGWNNLDHVCFDSLEVVATWDFVNGDSSVANDPGQMGDGSHGTKTLSCLAGYDPGELIGTAYGISVALAKTENTQGELQIEEDNWVAGLEWLDSLGCVIVTSSVSYLEFDPQDSLLSYSWEDLDGNTAISTIGADNAVARGVVVLNSDGNNGNSFYPDNKMNVPADGDSVLCIGSVTTDSTLASFSSYGPTYDGRIKPDLVAKGTSVRVASSSSPTGYGSSSGSSFSTPITAGACALLLQADPSLTPMEVHSFLKATGDQAANPDTLRGWGIYDVWAAIQAVLMPVKEPELTLLPAGFKVSPPYPNPFNNSVTIPFSLPKADEIRIQVYTVDGRLIFKSNNWYLSGDHRSVLDFRDTPSGAYLCRIVSRDTEATTKLLYLK